MITRHPAYDLSRRNTFGMNVSCRLYVEITDPADLPALNFEALPQPVFILGGGSNLLFTQDFPGTVLHLANRGIEADAEQTRVRVAAGTVFDDFCAWAAAEGLWGPENLSLIPGEAGASAVQNIGAYGVEVKDIIDTVHAFDRAKRRFVDIPGSACGYGYRTSHFKTGWKGRYCVTAVTFRLSRSPKPVLDYGGLRKVLEAEQPGSTGPDGAGLTPQRVRDTVIGIRQKKLPDPAVLGSAGSFFCNPVIEKAHFRRIEALAREEHGADYAVPHYEVGDQVKVPAAWMIDTCGFKGVREGGAQVYPGQPLVIVNATGHATPEEILALERRIVAAVKGKYGIELHPEVEHI